MEALAADGFRGTLANTHDLVRIGLVVVVRVAFSKVDVPGFISIVGNRGPGPENPSPFFVPLNKTVSGHHKDGTKTANINCGRKNKMFLHSIFSPAEHDASKPTHSRHER